MHVSFIVEFFNDPYESNIICLMNMIQYICEKYSFRVIDEKRLHPVYDEGNSYIPLREGFITCDNFDEYFFTLFHTKSSGEHQNVKS